MQINPAATSAKGSDAMFTGDVYLAALINGQGSSRIRLNMVYFTPGSRTAWHSHSVGQTLHVTEGVGLVQSSGGEIVVMRAGETVYSAAGEWHWHGATRKHFMSHLAVSENPESGEESAWGDQVKDDEYDAQPEA